MWFIICFGFNNVGLEFHRQIIIMNGKYELLIEQDPIGC